MTRPRELEIVPSVDVWNVAHFDVPDGLSSPLGFTVERVHLRLYHAATNNPDHTHACSVLGWRWAGQRFQLEALAGVDRNGKVYVAKQTSTAAQLWLLTWVDFDAGELDLDRLNNHMDAKPATPHNHWKAWKL